MAADPAGRIAHDWALVVATYNRPEALATCVRLALAQGRPPREVVIVDAGPAWAESRDRVAALVAAQAAPPRLTYLRSETPSLTVQRNIGVAAATAAVVFLIDDDSFLFPDCAERIMAVYDADPEGRIAGVQAFLARESPVAAVAAPLKGRNDRGLRALLRGPRLRRLRRLILGRLFLTAHDRRFVAYDGRFHDPAPEAMAAALPGLPDGVKPQRLFHGCRMTYRRDAALAEPFDDVLRFYCPYEDLDASYRISRHGWLALATAARLHHAEAAGARLDRGRVTLLSCLNLAFLIRRHAADPAAGRRAYAELMRRHMLAEALKEAALGRWRFPQLRATLAARRAATALFDAPPERLREDYVAIQTRIVRGDGRV